MNASCDYHLFSRYLSYEYAGTLNNRNILNLSPLLGQLLGGSLDKIEQEAGLVQYKTGGEWLDKTFMLVNEIYLQFSIYVHGIEEPMNKEQKFIS